ncbi:hypothetical protein D3C74_241280 [compost metagenome]
MLQEWRDGSNMNANLDFSPDWLYNECKFQETPDTRQQEGTEPRLLMKVLQKQGAVQQKYFPTLKKQDLTILATHPQLEDATKYKVDAYAEISTLVEAKQAMYYEGPIVAAGFIFENFAKSTGLIGVEEGAYLGGHAYAMVGWDDNLTYEYPVIGKQKGHVAIVTSWGDSWGLHGVSWVPYYMFTYRNPDTQIPFFTEMWSSLDIRTSDVGIPDEAIKEGFEVLELKIGSSTASVDGKLIPMAAPPILYGGSTLVPLRFVAEQLGLNVSYTASTKIVRLTRK